MYSESEIAEVKARALLYELEPAKGRGVYVCPSCGRPRVYNPTVAGVWYCQRCKEKGDVFTAVRLRNGVTHEAAFADVMNRYGHGQQITKALMARVSAPRDAKKAAAVDDWRAECRRYLLDAAAAFPGSPGADYMHGRGFTDDTLQRFGVGYDARATIHGALTFGRQAVVYPYSRALNYYAARFLQPITDADGGATKAMKPPAARAGGEPLFNAAALWSCGAVIVCEGAFDALAIAQGATISGADAGAVALCGTGGGRLIRRLMERPTAARLFIALDNDEAGRAGAYDLAARLGAIQQPFELMDSSAIYAGYKDAGELLQVDAAAMGDAVDFMLNEPAARL